MNDFIDYCWEFYGTGGIYEIAGITKTELKDACLKVSKLELFEGDSLDRERVREVILQGDKALELSGHEIICL